MTRNDENQSKKTDGFLNISEYSSGAMKKNNPRVLILFELLPESQENAVCSHPFLCSTLMFHTLSAGFSLACPPTTIPPTFP